MNPITKDQIQHLTPEQQDAIATTELRLIQKRQRLLTRARQSKYSIFATGAMLAIAYIAAAILKAPPLFQLGFLVLAVIIMAQFIAINRRLDALLELFEDH